MCGDYYDKEIFFYGFKENLNHFCTTKYVKTKSNTFMTIFKANI